MSQFGFFMIILAVVVLSVLLSIIVSFFHRRNQKRFFSDFWNNQVNRKFEDNDADVNEVIQKWF